MNSAKQLLPLILLSVALFSGCISSGTKVSEQAVAKIEKGKTTKAELIAMLGPPLSATFLEDGREMLAWSHGQWRVNPVTLIPLVGPIVGGVDQKVTNFEVVLNQSKIVDDMLWNTGTSDSRVWSANASKITIPEVELADAKANEQVKQQMLQPSADARLYVYRERRFKSGGLRHLLYLDGRELGAMGSGTFVTFTLPPGRHVLRVRSSENNLDTEIDLIAGTDCYLKVEPSYAPLSAYASVSKVGEDEGRKGVTAGRLLKSAAATATTKPD